MTKLQTSKAIIYKPAKSAMQSGKGKTKFWWLKFEKASPNYVDNLIGWQGSKDMKQEIKLKFQDKESAIEYAESQNLDFEVIEPDERKVIIKSYADNFSD